MSNDIRFPQGPFLDGTYPSLEWFMWLQNPQFSSIVIGAPIDVESGGTGLTSGTSGGVLAFTGSETIVSSTELLHDQIVLGGGAGSAPRTPVGLGTGTTVLHGNAAGAPTWSKVDLSVDTVGSIGVPQGGTGLSSGNQYSTLVFNTTTSMLSTPTFQLGQILVGQVGVPVPKTISGDATLAASGALTIGPNKITNAKLAQAPTLTLKGNNTGGTANVADLTVSQANTMLGCATGVDNLGGEVEVLVDVTSNDVRAHTLRGRVGGGIGVELVGNVIEFFLLIPDDLVTDTGDFLVTDTGDQLIAGYS